MSQKRFIGERESRAMPTSDLDPSPYLGDGATLLSTVFAGEIAVEDVEVVQVQFRPGRSLVVQYAARLSKPGDGVGERRRIVVHVARNPLEGLEPVAHDEAGRPVCAFVGHDDPALPGLPIATDPGSVSQLFADLGIGAPDDPIRIRVRAHRPLRRAVVEATGPHGRLFLKIVPPRRAADLHRRHRALTAADVPVAPSVGWSTDGIVVIGAISGNTLRQDLNGDGPLPRLAEVHSLLDRFPEDILDLDGPAEPIGRLAEHAELLGRVLPSADDRARRLAATLSDLASDGVGSQPTRPDAVHGDLYEAQIMTGGGRVRGLIDVDGVGAGHRINDDANALGHLSVYDLVVRHDRARRLGGRWIDELDRSGRHHPAELRARVAAVVVGLATGSFRVQEANWQRRTHDRLELAEAWLASAQRAGRPRRPATAESAA